MYKTISKLHLAIILSVIILFTLKPVGAFGANLNNQEMGLNEILMEPMEAEMKSFNEAPAFPTNGTTLIESITLLSSSVTYGDYQMIEVKLKPTNYYMNTLQVTASNEKGETRDFHFKLEQNSSSIFIHEELVSFLMNNGTYKVTGYWLKGNYNGKVYEETYSLPYKGSNHPLSKTSFIVSHPKNVEAKFSFDKTSAKLGDKVRVRLEFNTPDIFEHEIRIALRHTMKNGNDSYDIALNKISSNVYEGFLTITPYMNGGSIVLRILEMKDMYIDLSYQTLPFKLTQLTPVLNIAERVIAPSGNSIKSVQVLTPVINAGEDIKVVFEFNKDINLYEIETSYVFVEGYNFNLGLTTPQKLSSRKYQVTIPSHMLSLMEFHDVYDYMLRFWITDMDGIRYFPNNVSVKINRNGRRMYAFAESSVSKNTLSSTEEGVITLKYPTDAPIGKAIVAYYGQYSGSWKYVEVSSNNLDTKLSDSQYNVYSVKIPRSPFEKEERWNSEYIQTYYMSGFKLKQAVYGHFTFGEQVSYENLSHLDLRIVEDNLNTVERTQGDNRYASAVRVSEKSFVRADTAIIVSGVDFPDALAAGPLAYAMNAPILLVNKDRISSVTHNELFRLGVRKAIILGGESVISSAVTDALDQMGIEHLRIAGSNRYGTTIAVADRLSDGNGNEKVILTSAMDYADSLSIGSYAARQGLPILLTNPGSLRDDLAESLTAMNTKEILIMGGMAAVSNEVEMKLKDMGMTVTRISGENRYLTAMESAKKLYPAATECVIASGENFADALAAVPYAAMKEMPIMLVRKGAISQTVKTYLNATSIRNYEIIGGLSAVNRFVEYDIINARIR